MEEPYHPEQQPHWHWRLAIEAGLHQPRRHGIGGRATTCETAGESPRQQPVARLGLLIGLDRVVRALRELQVVDVEVAGVCGRDVDDARGRAGLEDLQELVREQMVAEYVGRQGELDAIGALAPCA